MERYIKMNNIIIGRGTNINGRPNFIKSEHSKIIIGNFCAFASDLTISTLNHDYNYFAIQGLFLN